MVYTSGDFTVRPGLEQRFIEAWSRLLKWAVDEVPGCRHARLCRHIDEPNRFLGLATWDDSNAVPAWRQMPRYQELMAVLWESLAEGNPWTLLPVAEITRSPGG